MNKARNLKNLDVQEIREIVKECFTKYNWQPLTEFIVCKFDNHAFVTVEEVDLTLRIKSETYSRRLSKVKYLRIPIVAIQLVEETDNEFIITYKDKEAILPKRVSFSRLSKEEIAFTEKEIYKKNHEIHNIF